MQVKIDGWRSHILFSSAHFIPEYDKCGRLHGHTYAVHAVVEGKQDEMGIVVDFSTLKETLQRIADELDHYLLIPKRANIELTRQDDSIETVFRGKRYVLPAEDCLLLPLHATSAENLAGYILKRLREEMTIPPGVTSISIGVDEGYGQGAWTTE
ncbi:MAG: 6-pyruvoyl trahydropterin synthase family protein [Thermoplasmatota archaeon]